MYKIHCKTLLKSYNTRRYVYVIKISVQSCSGSEERKFKNFFIQCVVCVHIQFGKFLFFISKGEKKCLENENKLFHIKHDNLFYGVLTMQ